MEQARTRSMGPGPTLSGLTGGQVRRGKVDFDVEQLVADVHTRYGMA